MPLVQYGKKWYEIHIGQNEIIYPQIQNDKLQIAVLV